MELIYLYIEDYKNIKNQEFNFSSKFTCKYDEVKKTLQIDEKNNHIENFFGENINITAIVGENGSGKSSVLEVISKIISNDITDLKYILLTKEDGLKFDRYSGTLFSSKEELMRLITCGYISDDDINKRPLSKLIKDISDDLGFR